MNELLLNKLTELTDEIKKANKLKEHELQAKSREIFALEKRNNINEEYNEMKLEMFIKEQRLKERELDLKEREIEILKGNR